ncbi:hypothetical protein IJI79_00335 [Candidatus Saccharibacteria bacterium]|nr:hypothetical protein [Candidatus Saccharibacteria bacterium]MBR0423943.1 hypothetical protein [Candidatus Saccharibacteria bacterium]
MSISIFELYQILANNPDGFRLVLTNLCGCEISKLKARLDETVKDTAKENGEDRTRNHFIEDDMDKLAERIEETAEILAFFRYVIIRDEYTPLIGESQTALTAEDIRVNLLGISEMVKTAKEEFHEGLAKKYDHAAYRVQDLEKFEKEKDKLMHMLAEVDTALTTIDQDLKD